MASPEEASPRADRPDVEYVQGIVERVPSALGSVPPAEYEAQWYAEHLNASR